MTVNSKKENSFEKNKIHYYISNNSFICGKI